MSSELVWFGFPSHGDYQERCFPQSLPITFVSHLEKAFLDSTNIMASSVCFLFYSFSSNDFLLKQRLPTFSPATIFSSQVQVVWVISCENCVEASSQGRRQTKYFEEASAGLPRNNCFAAFQFSGRRHQGEWKISATGLSILDNLSRYIENTAKIENAVQCHPLLPGHYYCHALRFSIVKHVNNFTTSLGLAFEGVL